MPIKSVKMKIVKNKIMHFFLMSQRSLNQKIWFLGQKVCSVARLHTDTRTHTQVNTETPFQCFRNFPFIKDGDIDKEVVKSLNVLFLETFQEHCLLCYPIITFAVKCFVHNYSNYN